MNPNQFSTRLKSLRTASRYTRSELDCAIGFNGGYISRYEKGKNLPSFESLMKISNYFNVTLDWLTGQSDKMRTIGEPGQLALDDFTLP